MSSIFEEPVHPDGDASDGILSRKTVRWRDRHVWLDRGVIVAPLTVAQNTFDGRM
ncbi:hypothetical protein IQ235_16040 [Oscillatoriales cyanobacterium LEGE 11467]|uniref:Uncharacterized protein n=1 Tax=Zarconia navalis LEGE 11467 TaxID=1828826 RepID=A0A928W2Y1_9CYAN|nr:hypothetical protein [Zarconia navalis LEGE 11467]